MGKDVLFDDRPARLRSREDLERDLETCAWNMKCDLIALRILPEPTVIAPDAEGSETCHFREMEAFVVTCGREKITEKSNVSIYPYDTMTKAKEQYFRLWLCSKRLYRSLNGFDIAREILTSLWTMNGDVADMEGTRKLHQLDLISYTWLEKMLHRELAETRENQKIPKKREENPLSGDEWAYQCTEDVELTIISGGT